MEYKTWEGPVPWYDIVTISDYFTSTFAMHPELDSYLAESVVRK